MKYVTTAEAAFIGGISAAQMNRLVDEQLVPCSLFAQQDGSRRFVRLAAAFAKFFFETEPFLTVSARKQVLMELTARIEQLQVHDQIFALMALPRELDWKIDTLVSGSVQIDVSRYVTEAMARAMSVDNAEQLVTQDSEVMGGLPCFTGTRLPIENVLASLEKGASKDRLIAAYPFLTDADIDAASIYATVHPRRGRPRGLSNATPRISRKITKLPGL